MSTAKHVLPIMHYADSMSNQNTPFANVVEKALMVCLNKINILEHRHTSMNLYLVLSSGVEVCIFAFLLYIPICVRCVCVCVCWMGQSAARLQW